MGKSKSTSKKDGKKAVKSIYNTEKYKRWRKKVFVRDSYKCKLCGTDNETINAHHILRKADHPNLTYVLNNGITLCEKCHYVVTGKERVFAPLFNHINNRTLTIEYVTEFFKSLTTYHKSLVWQFKSYQKWLKIPETLVKQIKRIQSSRLKKSRSKTA